MHLIFIQNLKLILPGQCVAFKPLRHRGLKPTTHKQINVSRGVKYELDSCGVVRDKAVVGKVTEFDIAKRRPPERLSTSQEDLWSMDHGFTSAAVWAQ
jgi:hypothetical protein